MATLELVVGGPVCQRAWIIPTYFEYVVSACREADVVPEFVFAVPSWDEDTRQELLACSSSIGHTAEIISIKEPQRPDHRTWNPDRYRHMVDLRNQVLERVREIGPDFFWSLDSDILPRHDALDIALERFGGFDAIGMRTWMTPLGTQFPSCGFLKGEGMIRMDQEVGCFGVDIIMASKLMSPKAYGIDYEYDWQGEDIGWSKACIRAGLHLGWNAESLCKHVMSPDLLDKIDQRLGW